MVLVVSLGARTVEGAVNAGGAFALFDTLILKGTVLGWILRSPERIPGFFPVSPKWRFILFGLGTIQFARHPEGLVEANKRKIAAKRAAKEEKRRARQPQLEQEPAQEEVLAYQLARKAVNELIARNATFGALLFSDLSNKLGAIAERQSRHELQSLTLARVDEAYVREPLFMDADDDVLSAVRLFREKRTTAVLVRDAAGATPRTGIFTTNGLQRAGYATDPAYAQKLTCIINTTVQLQRLVT